MQIEDFNFHLPHASIAQQAVRRGSSRLLVLSRKENAIFHTHFRTFPNWLQAGDCLVVNDSKVIPARLKAVKADTGAKVELLLHQEKKAGIWEALAKPSRRLQPGTKLLLGSEVVKVLNKGERGKVEVDFFSPTAAQKLIQHYGITPLPPYIQRSYDSKSAREELDRKRYQTIFALHPGSVAAPTAGLHFSPSVLQALKQKGIHLATITLHIGWGTFLPLPPGDLSQQQLPAEAYRISEASANLINQARQAGGRIIACGTTVARTLETVANNRRQIFAQGGRTSLFIRPGYKWKMVDGLLTNFHLPKSSLYILVCAFASQESIKIAYDQAIIKKYRFYSYGDAMLLL